MDITKCDLSKVIKAARQTLSKEGKDITAIKLDPNEMRGMKMTGTQKRRFNMALEARGQLAIENEHVAVKTSLINFGGDHFDKAPKEKAVASKPSREVTKVDPVVNNLAPIKEAAAEVVPVVAQEPEPELAEAELPKEELVAEEAPAIDGGAEFDRALQEVNRENAQAAPVLQPIAVMAYDSAVPVGRWTAAVLGQGRGQKSLATERSSVNRTTPEAVRKSQGRSESAANVINADDIKQARADLAVHGVN